MNMTSNIHQPGADDLRPLVAQGLLRLLDLLKADGYRFITPTPATHRRVIRRPDKVHARSVRDVLGWSLPFAADVLPDALFDAMIEADVIRSTLRGLRATIRVSSLGDDLFIHSAFPPSDDDAVFFGPDTYRFADFLEQELRSGSKPENVIDIGAGSGAGAVVAARLTEPKRLLLTDVSDKALDLARINLRAAGITAHYRRGDALEAVDEDADLIIANPPFIADGGRTYRDGGDMHGARLSLDWAIAGASRLRPGGRMLLYSGSAIVEGDDPLRSALQAQLPADDYTLSYRELDPDIFGEQLKEKAYRDVERIAAIGAVITRKA